MRTSPKHDTNAVFRLFRTKNIFTLIKLDTSIGSLSTIQWGKSAQDVHTKPGGIRAAFSSDNGETWDPKTEFQIRNDFPNWDIGYPESMQNPDGSILSVYYYNLFGKYYIGGSTWNP